jgi:FkbM family methyltransferase
MEPNPDQWYGGNTYSQHGEDIVFLNIFRLIGVEKISWLDVGAHHPFRISNTALLYEKGHRGINVEANPNLMEAFIAQRPEDTNLNIGVADEPGSMNFYLIDKYSGRNSFSKHSAVEFVRAHPEFKITEIIKIHVTTIPALLKEGGRETFPDLLSLDVEGLDDKIILSLDLKEDGPKVICVEDNDRPDNTSSPLREHLAAQGYFPYYRAGVNILFVRNVYQPLLT